jgi:hypothetical protein
LIAAASLKPGADKKCWIAKLYNASGRPENIKLRGAICREGSLGHHSRKANADPSSCF